MVSVLQISFTFQLIFLFVNLIVPNFFRTLLQSIVKGINIIIIINLSTPKKMNILTVVMLLALGISSLAVPLKLYRHDISTGARCLDGSPSAFYHGPGQQTMKFILFFQGGGMCDGDTLAAVLQNCYNRSKTIYGSSKNYSEQRSYEQVSVLSSDPEMNPLYYNWTKIFIPYCDGTLHQGSKQSSLRYKDGQLFFRGTNNTLSHLQAFNNLFNFNNAEQVVVTGTSAGGIATFIWGNQIYHRMKNPNNLMLMPDSGIFISTLATKVFKKSLADDEFSVFNLTNTQIKMPLQECLAKYPDQAQCFNTSALDQFIIAPLFIIESLYDEYSLRYIYGLDCLSPNEPNNLLKCTPKQLDLIERYRLATIEVLKYYSANNKNAVWGISCVQHGFLYNSQSFNSQNYVVPYGKPKAKTILQVLAGFVMRAGNRTNIDDVKWPDNKGCNGIQADSFTQKRLMSLKKY